MFSSRGPAQKCERLPRLSELAVDDDFPKELPERSTMSNYDPKCICAAFSANGDTAIDVGIRAFMLRVYN